MQQHGRNSYAVVCLSLLSRRPWTEPQKLDLVASVAVTLDLEATGGLAKPREGRVIFNVFAFTQNGPGVKSIFQPWDDWGAVSRFSEGFPLKNTMTCLSQVCRAYPVPALKSKFYFSLADALILACRECARLKRWRGSCKRLAECQ